MSAKVMTGLPRRAGDEARSLAYLTRSGVVAPQLPHRLLPGTLAYWRYGALGWTVTAAAARYGDRVAVMDERGWVSFRELERRSNAVANGWRARGLRGGDTVGVLARNHRGFLDALFGAAKCGARIVLLNTEFSGPSCVTSASGRAWTCSSWTRTTSRWPRASRHGTASGAPGRTLRARTPWTR